MHPDEPCEICLREITITMFEKACHMIKKRRNNHEFHCGTK